MALAENLICLLKSPHIWALLFCHACGWIKQCFEIGANSATANSYFGHFKNSTKGL